MSERLTVLFNQFVDKTITPAEKRELSELSLLDENQEVLQNLIRGAWDNNQFQDNMTSEKSEEIIRKILNPVEVKTNTNIIWIKRLAVAVIAIGILFGSYELLFRTTIKTNEKPTIVKSVDVRPGTNRATLTLGNGATIILDSEAVGNLAHQGNTTITKTASGRLTYTIDNKNPSEILFNTLSTPRGGEYELTLPDGTRVWLNAASSISYPTAFSGTQRLVKMTGEAYFEVVHNAKMPFVVLSGDQTIEDIGTSFNINAYKDEGLTRVTLIQGAVNVKTIASSRRLAPNEQALLRGGQITVDKNVDVAKVIAWKRGLFEFNQTPLPVIMQQISRWYDVDIKFEGTVSEETLGGVISRNLPLSDVLKLLEANGVKFRLENKQLFVNYNKK